MADMRAPEKPHFMQPVLPGLTKDFFIPVAFFKYLNGKRCRRAFLRSPCGGKLWSVKIRGRRVWAGWKEFAEHLDLRVGDFLVFTYEGDLVFDVKVFDSSTCEKKYDREDGMNTDQKEDCREPVEADAGNGGLHENEVIRKKCDDSIAKSSMFVGTLRPAYANELCLPRRFTIYNGLGSECSEMIVRDDSGKLWPIKYRIGKNDQRAYAKWRTVKDANGLTEGDKFTLNVIDKGKKPVLQFHRLNQGKKENCREPVEADARNGGLNENGIFRKKCDDSSASNAKSSIFVGTMRPSYATVLCLPRRFTISNGLGSECSEMIVRDDSGKLWPIKLSLRKHDQRANAKWRTFKEANGLTEGDKFTLNVIDKGKKPVLQFRRLNQGKKQDCREPVEADARNGGLNENGIIRKKCDDSSASKAKSSIFVGTMRPSYATVLCLPRRFTISNGLGSEMVVRDDSGKLWPIKLRIGKNDQRAYAKWRTFKEANGLTEGDKFTLNVIEKGRKPVLQFCRLNIAKKVMERKFELIICKQIAASIAGQSPAPHFLGIMRLSDFYKAQILIPREFTISNGSALANRQGEMIIRYSTEDSWVIILRNHIRHRLYIGSGRRRTVAIHHVLKVVEKEKYRRAVSNGTHKRNRDTS
ncbi:hypothetical protein QQ045_027094 [Rhodiola kirilowii]